MANPLLNEKKANEVIAANQAGWGAPDPATRNTPIPGTPMSDGPISPWDAGRRMTVGGTATATAVLLVLLLAAATYGWKASDTNVSGQWNQFPTLAIVGIIVGFICAIVVAFKPGLARILGPIYALGEGVFLGAISKAYNELPEWHRRAGHRRHAGRVRGDARAVHARASSRSPTSSVAPSSSPRSD